MDMEPKQVRKGFGGAAKKKGEAPNLLLPQPAVSAVGGGGAAAVLEQIRSFAGH